MTLRPRTAPRKPPTQRRSQATVDALVEATARLLVEEGYERASTNRIAARAGVSIGSLYQYFPSKEALVAAVVERHTQDLSSVALGAFLRIAERPIELGLRELVVGAIDAHRVDPALHRILAEEAPRIGPLGDIDAVQRRGRTLIRGYLETHRDEIEIPDPDLAAFVLVTTIEALTHAAVLHRPDMLTGAGADAFADEVTGLLLRYLRAATPASPDVRPGAST